MHLIEPEDLHFCQLQRCFGLRVKFLYAGLFLWGDFEALNCQAQSETVITIILRWIKPSQKTAGTSPPTPVGFRP